MASPLVTADLRFRISSPLRVFLGLISVYAALAFPHCARAEQELLKTHCAKCHSGSQPKGDFDLEALQAAPTDDNVEYWLNSLDFVKAEEMPPAKHNHLSEPDRQRLIEFLAEKIRNLEARTAGSYLIQPRRLNNRELENSLRDVLLIEDIGTHQPTANLLGDTLQDGFDTNGEALGLSEFHLEQYINAFRNVLDATIVSGKQPESRKYHISSSEINMVGLNQNSKRDQTKRNADSVDFLDLRRRAYCASFRTVPETGRYRITIRATGIDRGIYDSDATGVYRDDAIQLRVHMGDRTRDFDLPDNTMTEVELNEWLAKGTRFEMSYPTDGLRLKGNGNFKFQYRIAHDYIKENDPALYAKVLKEVIPRSRNRKDAPGHWSHWTEFWQGPRPRLYSVDIEGPIFESWPSKRQVALIGSTPNVKNAASILRPIAERAWRRDVGLDELSSIASLVQSRAPSLGDVEALKEGIVAILLSPSFLLINSEQCTPSDHFATKLSYFLRSTTPDARLRELSRASLGSDATSGSGTNSKGEVKLPSTALSTFEGVRREVQRHIDHSQADEFLREFPNAWLQLDRINFMSPDPERYPLYDRKRLSEDMVAEVQHFFRYAVDHNLPVTELISADYSFLNADLAKVYHADGIPEDSKLRKYTFADGRRGGLLGMGAFLTLTADSLGTSPIHRAVYVMENFLGIHPSPPPPDVKIAEPDVRKAKTIKKILETHKSDKACAACHQSIDPFGYAFENFDPVGTWRNEYTAQIAPKPSKEKLRQILEQDKLAVANGLPPQPRPWENKPIPIDASAIFRNGTEYQNIIGFRELMLTQANRERFVRCFIVKLLTYANGSEPNNFSEIENIVAKSAEHDYRIVDTIAAVIDSPLFRERLPKKE